MTWRALTILLRYYQPKEYMLHLRGVLALVLQHVPEQMLADAQGVGSNRQRGIISPR